MPAAVRQRVVFNGRFLAQVHTGVQRYAAETLLALDALLAARPELSALWQFELAVPDAARPLPLSCIRRVHVSGRGGHLWEQWPLLRHSHQAFLVNFNYSGPLLKRRQLITIHDATVRAMPQAFSRAYRWVHNAMVSVLGRSAASVMTVSVFSRRELRRWFGLRRADILFQWSPFVLITCPSCSGPARRWIDSCCRPQNTGSSMDHLNRIFQNG